MRFPIGKLYNSKKEDRTLGKINIWSSGREKDAYKRNSQVHGVYGVTGVKEKNISKIRSPVLNIAEISSKVQFYEFSICFT